MSDASQPNVQPRATTPEGIRLEDFARSLLAGAWAVDPRLIGVSEVCG